MWDVGFSGRLSRMRHQSLMPTNNNKTRVILARRYNMGGTCERGDRETACVKECVSRVASRIACCRIYSVLNLT